MSVRIWVVKLSFICFIFCYYFIFLSLIFSFILLFEAFLLIHCIIFILLISFALSVLFFLAKFVLVLPYLFGYLFFFLFCVRFPVFISLINYLFFFTKNEQPNGYQRWIRISEPSSNSVLASCIHSRTNALEKDMNPSPYFGFGFNGSQNEYFEFKTVEIIIRMLGVVVNERVFCLRCNFFLF